MQTPLSERQRIYFQLSSRLALLDNVALCHLLDDRRASVWGDNQVVRVGRRKVFVKRISVTELEYANVYSTANHFELPTYFNYGVGSAGFGIFREIVAHIKTTHWVLEGSLDQFPLLYHWRIVPVVGEREAYDDESRRGFVRYWNNSQQVDRYMRARAAAPYQAILFLEHFPHTLGPWLEKNTDQLESVIAQGSRILGFLRRNQIIHFDAHFFNFLTDGERVYLTDFGLALDRKYALSERERTFFTANRYYDCGEFISCIADLINWKFRKLSQARQDQLIRRCGLAAELERRHIRLVLTDHAETIAASGLLRLNEPYLQTLARYREIVQMMQTFFAGMGENERKDTQYSHTKLRRLVREVGFAE